MTPNTLKVTIGIASSLRDMHMHRLYTEVGYSPLFIYYELLLVAMGLAPCKLTDSIKHKIHADCNTLIDK